MTEIHQKPLASRQPVDDIPNLLADSSNQGGVPGRQILDGTHNSAGTINISFNAHMRLRAYEEQRNKAELFSPVESSSLPEQHAMPVVSASPEQANGVEDIPSELLANRDMSGLSEHITGMLSEVHDNIVQASEPGYRYLVNMLNNYQTNVENSHQLQEIMRKEEFYLNRRKPFMDSSDFQSYSQVLSQFANIVERQQYS